MEEIKIQFDLDTKTIHSVEGTEKVDPLEIAKIMLGMTMRSLSMIKIEEKKDKIIQPKTKIIGGNNGKL